MKNKKELEKAKWFMDMIWRGIIGINNEFKAGAKSRRAERTNEPRRKAGGLQP